MQSYISFQNLLAGFDASIDDEVIEESLWKFAVEAGYQVRAVNKYLVLGKTRFFRIVFNEESDAILFSTAFFPIFDDFPPINLSTSSVSIEVD